MCVWAGIFSAYMWIPKSAGWLDGCHAFIWYLLKFMFPEERRAFQDTLGNLRNCKVYLIDQWIGKRSSCFGHCKTNACDLQFLSSRENWSPDSMRGKGWSKWTQVDDVVLSHTRCSLANRHSKLPFIFVEVENY